MSVGDNAAGNNTLNMKASICFKYSSGVFFVNYTNQTPIHQSMGPHAFMLPFQLSKTKQAAHAL